MQTKYTLRRADLTREQSTMVRKMLDEKLSTIKNHIVSAVDCGEDTYATTGLSGYAYARKLCRELHEYQALCQIFPPDDMWEE